MLLFLRLWPVDIGGHGVLHQPRNDISELVADNLSWHCSTPEVSGSFPAVPKGSLEGIAYRKGWINEERMRQLAQPMLKNQYGQYLICVIDEIKRTGNPNI